MKQNPFPIDEGVKWKQNRLNNDRTITFYLRNQGPSFEELALCMYALVLDDVKRNRKTVSTITAGCSNTPLD